MSRQFLQENDVWRSANRIRELPRKSLRWIQENTVQDCSAFKSILLKEFYKTVTKQTQTQKPQTNNEKNPNKQAEIKKKLKNQVEGFY